MAHKQPDTSIPYLGFGLGLRPVHYPYIFEHRPEVDWFEIISENFMDTDGKPKRNLARIRADYPVVMHGVALSIGTVDPLNSEYLTKLKQLIEFVEPAWVSDHLCWTGVAHKNSHDLLPVPYTEEALSHIVSRIQQVQEFLGRELVLENPSTYLEFKASHIPEAEFIAEMARRSGCRLLLDVNNVYVTCYNHRLDPKAYLDALPLDRVAQIHLSGHTNKGTHIVDTHDDHVIDEVWALYRYVTHKAGYTLNTMVEWDANIPEFPVLLAELAKAKNAAKDAANYAPLPHLAAPQVPYVGNKKVALSEAQKEMQDAILNGEDFDSATDSWIRAKTEFAPVDQLGVYVKGYRYRLYDVVVEDYPVLQHYLGEEAFDNYISGFVNSAASEHFNIGRYAIKLPAYLAQQGADRFACELAELETAVAQLTDPQETLPLTPEHLAGIDVEKWMAMTLTPRKALRLMGFTYPVNAYYIAVQDEQSPDAPAPEASFLAVFRHEDSVWRMALEENEYHLLTKLFAGMPIGAALEALQQEQSMAEDALAGALSNWFARWMRNGLLAAGADGQAQQNAA